MLHLLFYYVLALMLFVGLLAGCAGLDAAGSGLGMAGGYNPPIYQPMPILSAHRQSCVMQQDPIGTLWGTPTMRMSCY